MLASERPNPLSDLESLLPVSHTFEDEDGFTTLCNDLLVLNAHEHSDPNVRSINIPGSKVMVTPFQFYHAYHMLSQRGRDLEGGILADDAGTGKTYILFTACLLRGLIFESERAVKLHWSGKGRKRLSRHAEQHLPEGANGRSCPSQKHGQIVCYCVPGSLTRILCDKTPRGVSSLYCALETWPDIMNMVQAAALNPSIYQLCMVHNNVPMRFTRPLQPLVKSLSRGAEPDLRNPSLASYIFITTLNSPRLWNAFSEAGLNAGFIVVDEAHQVLKTSLTFRMAAEFSGNGADVWLVTATPFSRVTLADWIAPMKLIAPNRVAAMEALVNALDTAKSSGDIDDGQIFRDQFKAVFDEKLVLRHFGTSTFFGKPISDVQDIEPRVISRETPAQHKIAVQELANQVAYRDRSLADVSQRGLLYLVSLFPAAAQLILDDPISFDVEVIRDFVRQAKNRLRIEESEPLKRLADQIVKDSPKLDYILEELERMDLDKREREPVENRSSSKFGAGEDLQMKKMVIITPTAVTAVFLYLALIKHRKDVALLHNWVSSEEKEQVINNFASLSAAKLVKHNRILIAPFAVAGTGVNLQVASYQILTSPLPEKTSQLQAFARTNRSGQRLRPLSHRILVLEDSPVDRIMLANHATRHFESDPFNISEPLLLAGDEGLGSRANPLGVIDNLSSSSRSSSLGVNDGFLLQGALNFPPPLKTDNDDVDPQKKDRYPEKKDLDNRSRESFMGLEGASNLQEAMIFSPWSNTDSHGRGTEAVEGDDRPHAAQQSSSSFGTHWNLTYTPAPRHPFNRPLPPLPTDIESTGQRLGHRCNWPTLLPPLPDHPPVRIDGGPTLTSSRGQSVSTTPPPTRYRIDVNRDNFEIWVSDSASQLSESGPDSQLDPLSLRLPSSFSPSFGNITAIVDRIRREGGPSQRGRRIVLDGDDEDESPTLGRDLSNQGYPTSPIRRVPGPVPGQRQRQYGDDIPESDRNLANRPMHVLDIIRTARGADQIREASLDVENAQDAETLDERRRAARERGGTGRRVGQEFHHR